MSTVAIGIAGPGDLDGILTLQDANQGARGGTLSAALPRARLEAMLADLPLVVARREARVVGFLLAASQGLVGDIPIIAAMLKAYPGTQDAYVYGPVVVAAEERGHGIAQSMFAALRRALPGREGILFIRRDNFASLRAHEKMGMRRVAGFDFGGAEHDVLAYIG